MLSSTRVSPMNRLRDDFHKSGHLPGWLNRGICDECVDACKSPEDDALRDALQEFNRLPYEKAPQA